VKQVNQVLQDQLVPQEIEEDLVQMAILGLLERMEVLDLEDNLDNQDWMVKEEDLDLQEALDLWVNEVQQVHQELMENEDQEDKQD